MMKKFFAVMAAGFFFVGIVDAAGAVVIDFENQNLSDWSLYENKIGVSSMSVIPGNLNGSGSYNLAVEVDNTTNDGSSELMAAFYNPSSSWNSYNFEFDCNISSSAYWTYMMSYFYSQSITDLDNAYRLTVAPMDSTNKNKLVLFVIQDGIQTELGRYNYDFQHNTTYHLSVDLIGDNINIFLDGSMVLSIADTTFRTGALGFGSSNAGIDNNARVYYDNISAAPVPEPATMLLFGTGIAGLAGTRIRKKIDRYTKRN